MMDYILSGNPREIEKVLNENRIRVQRGWITFTPCSRVDVEDNKYVVMQSDGKELPEVMPKPKPAKRTKKSE